MSIRYDGMTLQELESEYEAIKVALEAKRAEEAEAVKAQIAVLQQKLIKLHSGAAKLNVSKSNNGISGKGDGRAKPKPTHRDPATGATWASRGQYPRWLATYVEAGHNPDDYRIKENPAV